MAEKKSLPARPDLQWLRKTAKDNLKLARKSDAKARLADVQRSIAREYGFASWKKLKSHIDSVNSVPEAFNIGEEASKQWLQLVGAGDAARVRAALSKERRLVHVVGPHPFWGGRPQALHVSVERKDNPMFDLLMEFEADPTGNNAEYGHWSPLMLAAHRENTHALNALLKRRAKLGLYEALMLGDDERVDAILRDDPDVLSKPIPNNGSPIQFARTIHAIERLVALGASITQKDQWGTVPVDALSALGAKGEPLVKRLIQLGAAAGPDTAARLGDVGRLKQIAAHDMTLIHDAKVMHSAVGGKQHATVRWLLDNGANVNAREIGRSKQTALHAAAWNGDLEMVKLLVERGADVNARDEQYDAIPCTWAQTAIQVANRPQCQLVVDYLQPLSLMTMPPKPEPRTPVDRFIHLSTVRPERDHKSGTIDEAKEMLRANPELADASIYTACVTGNHRAIRKLIAANPALAISPGGFRNWLPLCYVAFSKFLRIEKKRRSRDFVRCAKLLLDAGADPNSYFLIGKDRETVLYGVAGVANDAPLTKLLLDRGAKVGDDFDHETLYHVTEFDDHACLKLVLAHVPKGSWLDYCMCHQMDREDAVALQMFIRRGADVNATILRGQASGFRPLHFAIDRRRSAKIIQVLLDAGADPTLTDAKGVTPLQLARRQGHSAAAKLLERVGPAQPPTHVEQFIEAAMSGQFKVAKRLLGAKGFVDALPESERALVARAAALNNIRAVKLLLDLGFDINAKGEWGGSAIHQAAWLGHVEIVKLLLSRGADLKQKQQFGGDALHTVIHGAMNAGHRNGAKIVKLIAEAMKPASLDNYVDEETPAEILQVLKSVDSAPASVRKSDWMPIMNAAFEGDASKVLKLLKAGANPNVISGTSHRYRPLHRAIEPKKTMERRGRQEVVKVLLEHGADPSMRAMFSRLTALQLAATQAPEFVPLLIEKMKPLDIFHACAVADDNRVTELLKSDESLAMARDANDWTPLHYAAASKMERPALLRIAKALLDAGADIAASYKFDGKWPISVLYHACGGQDFPEMTEWLLKAGADACDGESVFHAADEGHGQSLALIEKYTDKKKLAAECTWSLSTLLSWTRTRGMKWLLDHGAEPNALHKDSGNSALHEAAKNGASEKVIQMLLKFGADPKRKNRDGKSAIELAPKSRRSQFASR